METSDQNSLQDTFENNNTTCSMLVRTLYIQEQGAVLSRDHERVVIRKGGENLFDGPAIKIDSIVVFGNCSITVPFMKYAMQKDIPVTFLSNTGNYYGKLYSPGSVNVRLIQEQCVKSMDPQFSLRLSRSVIRGKIHNCRVLLQRHARKPVCGETDKVVESLGRLIKKVETVESLEHLRGIEGIAAAEYFGAFKFLLKNTFGFSHREKHPPADPVNSMLSFGYSLLLSNLYSFININGLSPYMGYFHANRGAHPVFASDMMEEFRAPVVDSLVLYIVNTGILEESSFDYSENNRMCLLKEESRKIFIKHFQAKMNSRVTHVATGLNVNWQKCIDLQIKEFSEFLCGKISEYRPMTARY